MTLPPVEFLFDSSKPLLQDLRLAALNRAANLSKQLQRDISDWIEQEAVAQLAEYMIEHREEFLARRQVEIKPLKVGWIDRDEQKTA